jgi:hypothetical protein
VGVPSGGKGVGEGVAVKNAKFKYYSGGAGTDRALNIVIICTIYNGINILYYNIRYVVL